MNIFVAESDFLCPTNMLKLHLTPLFKLRNIAHPYSFLRKHGFTHNTASKLISGESRECRYAHIEELCRLLLCTPNDLFLWKPQKEEVYPDELPLRQLMRKPEAFDLNDVLNKLPLEKVHRFTKQAKQLLEDPSGLNETEPEES